MTSPIRATVPFTGETCEHVATGWIDHDNSFQIESIHPPLAFGETVDPKELTRKYWSLRTERVPSGPPGESLPADDDPEEDDI